MQRTMIILATLTILVSCGRKTLPEKTVGAANKPGVAAKDKNPAPTKNPTPVPAPADSAAAESNTAVNSNAMPLVVIDGLGNIVTTKDQLPQELAIKTDYRTIARAFTPNQRANLIYRYKMVPPRVLYVPEQYIVTSARGKYIIYRKKFWYWQKKDGLFYLDETYYR
ncbi:MAG: hypothetical protein GXC72_04410 [Chitinophagaceae bacterium]|nr:hypothetical protein [Chitinophagaceae bacterium]